MSAFHYYTKTENTHGHGRVSFAGITSGNNLLIGAAVCGRKEQFNRARGRQIAVARAEKGKTVGSIDIEGKTKKEINTSFIAFCTSTEAVVPYGTGDKVTFKAKEQEPALIGPDSVL